MHNFVDPYAIIQKSIITIIIIIVKWEGEEYRGGVGGRGARGGSGVVTREEVVVEGADAGEVEEGAAATGDGGRGVVGEVEATEEGAERGVGIDEGGEEGGAGVEVGAEGEDEEGEEDEGGEVAEEDR